MMILNLGCGRKTSAHPNIVNIDWSMYLLLRKRSSLRWLATPFMSARQRANLASLPENIVVHDLAKGIPYPDGSVDAVYHSHLLEHLDRDVAGGFLREIRRVLRPGGVQRIVVPDLERAVRLYLDHLSIAEADRREMSRHDDLIAAFLEQCVRRRPAASAGRNGFRRWLEERLMGDARQRGETHQWMYDRINLQAALLGAGFRDPSLQSCHSSSIPDWPSYLLDCATDGSEFNPGSLYMEALR